MNTNEQNQPSGGPPPLPERQRRLGHEVRSAAQGLLGYISIFNEEMKQRLTPEEMILLERIGHYGKRLSELSMELLSEIQDLTQQLTSRQTE